MIFCLWLPALAAPSVAGQLVWRDGIGKLVLDAPGQHVSPDAPSALQVGELSITLRGDPAALRFPVSQGTLSVVAEVALCTDGSGEEGSRACRSVRLTGEAFVQTRRGFLALVEESAPPRAPANAAPAGASGVVKGIDFGAVWCPPCNLLAAEILHDSEATAGQPIDAVDVDLPSSWAAKDRYDVEDYPTMVAVDAAGVEVDRAPVREGGGGLAGRASGGEIAARGHTSEASSTPSSATASPPASSAAGSGTAAARTR